MGVRVTPNLDTIGSEFPVCQKYKSQAFPDVAFGGGNYLVTFWDNFGHYTTYSDLYGARVSPAGQVLDTFNISNLPDMYRCYYSSVAYNSSRFLVVWVDTIAFEGDSCHIRGRFVENDGTLGDTFTIAEYGGVNSPYARDLRMVSSGSNFLVVWTTPWAVKGQLISNTGSLIGGRINIDTLANMWYPNMDVCCSGNQFLVTYTTSTYPYYLAGRFIDLSGNLIGGSFKINNTGNNAVTGRVVPGPDGRYLNVWSTDLASGDIMANLDVLMGVEEQGYSPRPGLPLVSFIISDAIDITEAQGIEVELLDITGRVLGKTNNGHFDCHNLAPGVYFLKANDGKSAKVIKVH